jgi:N12 class adenine-specific DNA methylase
MIQPSLFALPEPWEMTLQMYARAVKEARQPVFRGGKLTALGREVEAEHRRIVEDALTAGRPVPSVVINQYRDLAAICLIAESAPLPFDVTAKATDDTSSKGAADGQLADDTRIGVEGREPDPVPAVIDGPPTGGVADTPRGDSGSEVRAADTGSNAPRPSEGGCDGGNAGGIGPVGAPETPQFNLNNYQIPDTTAIGRGGQRAKFRANIAAIRLLKDLIADSKTQATAEERDILARFVGWGMFPQVFASTSGWEAEQDELESLLDPVEFAAARASTINAHYTSIPIVRAMWQMALRLGFGGGRVLEPASGIGHFFGCMPGPALHRSSLMGVELDPTPARIAQFLYPDATIRTSALQETQHLDGFFHLIIGNVPFGDITIRRDERYKLLKPSLHDYFFLRCLDELGAGCCLLLISSLYTLDSQDSRIREALAAKADLVAALRLPCDAFKANAGTEVVADIIILRKRLPGESPAATSWLHLKEVPDPDGGDAIQINEYFANNPAQILGRLDRSGTMYRADRVNVSPVGDFAERLDAAIARLPQAVYSIDPPARLAVPQRLIAPSDVKEGGYSIQDGKLYTRFRGELIECQVNGREQLDIIADTITVRDALRRVFQTQLESASEASIMEARERLIAAYDLFVMRHGYLHERKNLRAFAEDPDSPTVLALEVWDERRKTATKADVFFVNTVKGYARPSAANTLGEAIGISLNETARLDVDRIAELLGLTPEGVKARLVSEGRGYQDPVAGWTLADIYLSGNVRKKLLEAREAALIDPQFAANVTALEAVQPEDLDVTDIDVRLGSPWVPPSDILDFIVHLLGGEPNHFYVKFVPKQGAWLVGYENAGHAYHRHKPAATQIYGTDRANFMQVLQAALDDKPIVLYDEVDDRKVVNYEDSAAANGKVADVRRAFVEWIWQDDERRARLHRFYNDQFNNIRLISYDGSHLTFPGLNPAVTTRPHQANAVWRTIVTGALYAHEVGTGKTLIMACAAMELKRLGLANKPAIIALKSNIAQVVGEVRRLYPTARVITTLDRFGATERNRTVAQIATGDWDMVILTHDHADMLPMMPEAMERFIRDEIADLDYCIDLVAAEGNDNKGDARVIKRLEKMKERLEERLAAAIDNSRKDNAVFFEQTGIDFIFVDEAHKYKTLPCYTKRNRVKGIPSGRSDRATNMFMRTRWLQQRNNGRGVVFATGTPISNTMAELYVMQRYLQWDELESRGVAPFDSWSNVFGEVTTKMEYTVTGTFAAVSRFAKFVNLPELLQIAGQIMDVQFAEGILDVRRPVKEESVVTAPMSARQRTFLKTLRARALAIKGKRPEKGGDNMLAISTDARKSSLDHRLIDPRCPDYPDSKVNIMVGKVIDLHRARPDVTQVVFSDLGVTTTDHGFCLYRDIIAKLVAAGIPRDQILDFSSLSSKAKEEAMDRMRRGEALVAIGSTDTLGTGVNVQDRLAVSHNLDAPWLPAAVQQRDGRIWRHGNLHYEWDIPVKIYRYVTEGSFDAFIWQAVATKTAFIRQAMCGGLKQRVFKDEDTEELSPAKVMAIASGNPDLLVKVNLEEEVSDLEAASRRHTQAQYRLKDEAVSLRKRIEDVSRYIEALRADAQQVESTAGQPFRMEVLGTTYDKRDEAGDELYYAHRHRTSLDTVGTYRGFAITQKGYGYPYLTGQASYEIALNDQNPLATIASIEGVMRNLKNRIPAAEKNLQSYRVNLAKVEAEIGKPFRDAAMLQAKREALSAVVLRLAAQSATEPATPKPRAA